VGHGLRGRRTRQGSDLCIIAVGKLLEAAEAAAEQLEAQGVSVTVWDPRVIKPLDPDMLADAAGHPFVVTVEDGLRDGGVGAAISDHIGELALGRPTAPRVRVLGTPVAYIPHGKPDAILHELGLDGEGIAAAAAAMMRVD
jgi:1-deoxy-D-xylulose-5-phosphate synthase